MQVRDNKTAHHRIIQNAGDPGKMYSSRPDRAKIMPFRVVRARQIPAGTVRLRRTQALTVACENTTSISVPERPPVLIWNLARLASTRALVSDRLTPLSEVWSDGAWVRNGSSA